MAPPFPFAVVLLVVSALGHGWADSDRDAYGIVAANDGSATATSESDGASASVEQLLEELTKGKDRRKRARATILAMGPSATALLIANFGSPLFTVRWEIANILGATRDPRAIESLVDRVLHDHNSHVRWRSLWALGNMPQSPAIAAHFRAALHSDVDSVRWNAAVGGSMFSVWEALPVIRTGIHSTNRFRVWEAIDALSRLPDRSSVALLDTVVNRPDVWLRREAVLALGRLQQYPASTDRLIVSLEDEDAGVRWRAAMSLAKTNRATAVEALRRRLRIESDPLVIEHLEEALAR